MKYFLDRSEEMFEGHDVSAHEGFDGLVRFCFSFDQDSHCPLS